MKNIFVGNLPFGATEEALREQIAALAAAVSSQDLGSIQGMASSLLGMNPSLALRFQTTSTLADPPTPSADFAAFFSEVFAQNENIAVTMEVGTVNLNGTVAYCEVGFSLAATYILGVPPDDYRFPEEGAVQDVMVWEFDGASWQLVTWQEAAAE